MLAAVVPLLVFGALVIILVSRRFEDTAVIRLNGGLAAVERRLDDLRRDAATQVADIARKDGPDLPPGELQPDLAASIALARGLQMLEVVDANGHVLASHHWLAGLGLPEKDRRFGNSSFSLETVGADYGATERLAITATRTQTTAGGVITVRGGYFLDSERLRDLSALLGAEVAVRDTTRGRWITPEDSPLAAWGEARFGQEKDGEANLPAGRYRWAAAGLAPGLFLVVATPGAPLDRVRTGVFTLTTGLALLAAALAIAAGVVLSGRLARPLRVLAERARTLAAGDFDAVVEVPAEGEVGDLARAFNTMTGELREARARTVQAERVAAWREMARRLAHELKNPIFPIQLSIETLRRALDQETAAGGPGRPRFEALFRESSDTILDELRALRKIVDEFSEFARMPRPQFAPTDVNRVVEQALSLYQARAEGVKVASELEAGLPAIPADQDLLARALGNLVANAVEAMPEGGTLAVRTAKAAGGVVVEVADTGPGLTDDQRTRLFTPHYTTKKGGTGLGLAIVQGIVSDHGGRVEVQSEPGRGTTFTLFLPLVRPSKLVEENAS
jgi:two-component system, NtrC family, nitrogen regulation sensor histidine kinase NtrY